MPPPIPVEEESDTASDDETQESETPDEETNTTEENSDDAEDDESASPVKKSRAGRWIWSSILIILAAALCVAGYWGYKNYYLQPIESIILDKIDNGTMIVHISSHTDESKLTVICSDTYGNQLKSSVKNGIATFTGLAPNSAYTVKVEINGFHRLTGDTSTAFTTPVQTNIV
jgi:hypothetical protein